jgi:hypothetical protein
MMNFKGGLALGVAVAAMVLAGLVDFAMGILSRLVDFAFVGIALAAGWAYLKSRPKVTGDTPELLAERNRRIELEAQNEQLKREVVLLRDWTGKSQGASLRVS